MTTITKELSAKLLDLIKQLVPGLARAACLTNSANPISVLSARELEDAGRTAGVFVQDLVVSSPEEIGPALSAMTKSRAQALIVAADTMFIVERRRIVDFAAANRLPSIFYDRTFVEAGGLMSYGPDFPDIYRRSARYIDKILRGVKPADLPVERPTKIEFVVNLKTAQTLGLAIPQSIMLQATEVIR